MKSVDKKRHLAKTITWRIIASLDTFLIAWIITGKFDWAGTIAGIEVLTKMFLYYFHERAWYRFSKFGVNKQKLYLNQLNLKEFRKKHILLKWYQLMKK